MDEKLLFKNKKTKSKTRILRAYSGESEDGAVERLTKDGWELTDYKYDAKSRTFLHK